MLAYSLSVFATRLPRSPLLFPGDGFHSCGTSCLVRQLVSGSVSLKARSTPPLSRLTGTPSPAVNGQGNLRRRDGGEALSETEQRVLDRVGEALARLGRVKRVGLTMKDKQAFVNAIHSKKA
uniref:Uncharacterized protein n=1 Tax=Bionectria ochroleuca TaxID=29856 RepID=A0A8H7KE41_BIOOC